MLSFQRDWNRGGLCIQRCPHFKEVGIEGGSVYRGVLTSGGWNRGGLCIQRCPHFKEVGIEGGSVYRGVLISKRLE